MKAIVCTRYGTPDVLQLQEVPTPSPRENEALVKVFASSVNGADLETLRGDFVVRFSGPFRPKHKILGSDVAGRIEAVGSDVTRFKPGDEIWGDLSYPYSFGAFAEYVCIPEAALRRKPANMTFKQAAAVPTAAVVALQNLRDRRPIQPGQQLLLIGAGGSVGTFAIQIAKHFGAEVTAVDSPEKLEMLRSLGADHVIDYTRDDFARSGRQYDLILDVVVQRSISDYRRALSPSGIVVMVGGSMRWVFLNMLLKPLVFLRGNNDLGIVPWRPNDQADLDLLEALFDEGRVVPVIDRSYPLREVPEALRYMAAGYAIGKVVINVEPDDTP